jgi:hypothetical protein
MSEERKRRQRAEEESEKKEEEKEAFEAGRIIGVIARRNPELYRSLKEIIDLDGRKMTDILEDALQMYVEYRTEAVFMPRQLFYAMKMVERVSRWSIEMLVRMLQVVVGATQLFPSGYEEEKQPEKPSMPSELRAKMIELFIPILQNTMTMLFSSLSSVASRGMPMQQANIPPPKPESVSKIKVVSSRKKESQAQ